MWLLAGWPAASCCCAGRLVCAACFVLPSPASGCVQFICNSFHGVSTNGNAPE
ncbi:hypothetical protein PR003_g4389 [Phytophthora rubi]|uniref:Secreted protein n=1 Tax=Phytophthora rubi TaxID=129364 RepID=A0A6A4FME4_9STRA|nr:hypothetical protein PR003_g4389 [Phytophthora rubi]